MRLPHLSSETKDWGSGRAIRSSPSVALQQLCQSTQDNIGFFDIESSDLFGLPTASERGLLLWVHQKDYLAVGMALSVARKRADLSQVELAKRLGKPQSFISDLERGQRRIDVLELQRIAKALSTDPVRLFAEIVDRQAVAPKGRH